MKNLKHTIIDVRTSREFMDGHIEGSINIPVNRILEHIEELRNMPQPLILCCASGSRSSLATLFLRNAGISCENGGSWQQTAYKFQTV
jgi:rhodanese-related sulfurtransferase